MPRLSIASVLLLSLLAVPSGAAELVNHLVLRINDRIATQVDFAARLSERQQAILAAPSLASGERERLLDGAGEAVMAELYEELLLLSRADQLAVVIEEAEVDQAVARTRERMGIVTAEQLAEALAASGINEQELRARLRRNLLVQEVMGREVRSRLEIPDEELRASYRRSQDSYRVPAALHVREVIVRVSEATDGAAAAELAGQIKAELDAGATLEEVAARNAPLGATTEVVDLGWVERGDLDPELSEAAWALAVGEVSAPLPGRGGLHLLRLEERREERVRPFEEVREEVLAAERERRLAEEYPAYLRDLEERSHVMIDAPLEAAGFTGLPAPDAAEQPAAPSSGLAPAEPEG